MLLRLFARSAARAQRYADELEVKVEELGLEKAMVGIAYGEGGPTGEYIRGLAKLEADERAWLANFSAKAVGAGLNERMVRLAERPGEMLAAIVTTALAEVSLPDDVASALKSSIARQVRELHDVSPQH